MVQLWHEESWYSKRGHRTYYIAVRTGDEPLIPDDAVKLIEEMQEAQDQSYVLGLKLQLPPHVLDGIYERYSEPRDRLLHILIEFTKDVELKPTMRAIVNALKSPVVNLPRLAKILEAAHLEYHGEIITGHSHFCFSIHIIKTLSSSIRGSSTSRCGSCNCRTS